MIVLHGRVAKRLDSDKLICVPKRVRSRSSQIDTSLYSFSNHSPIMEKQIDLLRILSLIVSLFEHTAFHLCLKQWDLISGPFGYKRSALAVNAVLSPSNPGETER